MSMNPLYTCDSCLLRRAYGVAHDNPIPASHSGGEGHKYGLAMGKLISGPLPWVPGPRPTPTSPTPRYNVKFCMSNNLMFCTTTTTSTNHTEEHMTMTDDYPDTGDPVLDYQANLWRAMDDGARQRYRDASTLDVLARFDDSTDVDLDDNGVPDSVGPTRPVPVTFTYSAAELDRAAGLTS